MKFMTLMLGDDNILQFSFRNMVDTLIVAPVPDAAVRVNGLQYYLHDIKLFSPQRRRGRKDVFSYSLPLRERQRIQELKLCVFCAFAVNKDISLKIRMLI
jgi:hypothetical protein